MDFRSPLQQFQLMRDELPIIYIVDASVAVTGAFIAARNMARLLDGSARVVLILPSSTNISREHLDDFWRVEYLPIVSISKNMSAMLSYLPSLMLGTWKLRQLMRRDRATRLVLNDFYLMHGVMLRLLGFRGHIVSWVRCDPVRFAGALAKPMLSLIRWSANKRVTVSRFIESLLPTHHGATMIYDCYIHSDDLPRQPPSSDRKNLVYIGNYIRGKGQDMALRAFIIAAEKDTTLQLHFYGSDMGLAKNRAYREAMQSLAQSSAFADRIYFHDFIADTRTALNIAYAALNFSVCESFSMTVLEASGAGVPIIATMSGGPQEIIIEGVTGYLVPLGEAETAANRILKLAQNPEIVHSMQQEARRRIKESFSPTLFQQQIKTIFSI